MSKAGLPNETRLHIHISLTETIETTAKSYYFLKTEGYYLRVLNRAIRDLYNEHTTEDDFMSTMVNLLDGQMRRAWNEGMRLNGLDPATDMTTAWEMELQGIIDNEFAFVQRLIDDILQTKLDGRSVDVVLSRAQLWANRYNDVVNRAKIATAPNDKKFEWVLGDTEHCETCQSLSGIVATAEEWNASKIHPQMPPNPLLKCSGWNCQCELVPTDKRKTANALSRLLDIATARRV